MEEKLAEVKSVVDQIGLFENVPAFYHLFKRAVDIFGAVLGIILLSPVFLVTALLIKLTSPGGIFLSRREADLREKYLKCTNFAPW